MTDFDRECANCGRYLSIDDVYYEELNDYNQPVPICSDCGNVDYLMGLKADVSYQEYDSTDESKLNNKRK